MGPMVMKYRKYAGGGYALSAGLGVAQTGMQAWDAADSNNTDQFGMQKVSVGKSVASGAVTGASAGAVAGPWGALIGGVVGAGVGLISGAGKKKSYDALYSKYQRGQQQNLVNQGMTRINSDRSIVTGDPASGYYANGGQMGGNPLNLAYQQTEGGSVKPLSSSASEFNGPSHENGGIDVPGKGAEVEGGETAEGDYIFSERLGFAKAHKTLATAVGKIEGKSLAPERINALKLLKVKTEALKDSQEMVKQYLASKAQ